MNFQPLSQEQLNKLKAFTSYPEYAQFEATIRDYISFICDVRNKLSEDVSNEIDFKARQYTAEIVENLLDTISFREQKKQDRKKTYE